MTGVLALAFISYLDIEFSFCGWPVSLSLLSVVHLFFQYLLRCCFERFSSLGLVASGEGSINARNSVPWLSSQWVPFQRIERWRRNLPEGHVSLPLAMKAKTNWEGEKAACQDLWIHVRRRRKVGGEKEGKKWELRRLQYSFHSSFGNKTCYEECGGEGGDISRNFVHRPSSQSFEKCQRWRVDHKKKLPKG